MDSSLFKSMLLFTILTFASCKKTEIDALDNIDKLLGKWNWITQVTWYKPIGSNISYKDTTYISTGEYLEVKSNSTYIWKDSYGFDSGKYLISGAQLIFNSGGTIDSFEIKTLTDKSLTLYVNTTPGSEEIWNNFKK